jgi:hypothetical protein
MSLSKWEYIKSKFPDIEKWLSLNLSEKQIAFNLSISKTTLEKYKREQPLLLELLKKGRQNQVLEVENALMKKALGFEYEETETYVRKTGGVETTHIKKVKKYSSPDVGACAFILKNKDRQNWSDNPLLIQIKRELLAIEKQKLEEKW